jgi:hypothetical protein
MSLPTSDEEIKAYIRDMFAENAEKQRQERLEAERQRQEAMETAKKAARTNVQAAIRLAVAEGRIPGPASGYSIKLALKDMKDLGHIPTIVRSEHIPAWPEHPDAWDAYSEQFEPLKAKIKREIGDELVVCVESFDESRGRRH